MRRILVAAAVVLALASSLSLWASPFVRGTVAPAPPAGAHYGQEVVGKLDAAFLETMMRTERTVLQGLPLAGEGHADVELEAFSPFAPDCHIVEMTDAGPVEHPVPTDRRYFKARILGISGGFGLFVFEKNDFSGFLNVDDGLYIYGITPGPRGESLAASCKFDPTLRPESYRQCENDRLEIQAPLGDRPLPPTFGQGFSTTPLQANLALEMDYESYAYFGSVAASVHYAGDLAAAMSVIYQNDILTTIGVINVRVWSTSSDPYTSGTSTSTLLGDLKAEYLANMGSISRSSVMLMSRRNMGGIAYVDVLCNNTYGYAVCGIEGSFTYPTSAYTWDANCTTHELGHNFKSHHTHCYNVSGVDWIDKCYNQEGGCYSGTVVNPPMGEKTIMSYCHLLSPYQVTMTFVDKIPGTNTPDGLAGYTRSLIRGGAEWASCLAAPACAFTCTPSASASIVAPPATITFSANPVATSCAGTATWSWNFGDGGTSTLENPSHLYSNPGTYGWTVTGSLNGKTCGGSGSIQVTGCTLSCTASGPSTATTTTPAAFTCSGTPGPTCTGLMSYDWNYGDGTAHGTSQNPSHLYTAAGTYSWSVTLTISGTTCTKTGTITVTASCTLTCAATVPATGEAGAPVSFQGTATPSNCTSGVTYDWNFGDGSAHATTPNASHTYGAAGSYNWFLTTKVGSATCTKNGTITIAPGCVLSCSASATPSSGAAPLQVAFAVAVTPTGCSATPTYAWDFGNGDTSTVQNPTYTYTNPGTFNWSVMVSAEGRTCIQTGSVTVSAACVVTCTASATPASGLAPLEVTFSATSTATNCTGGTTYAWAFGDGGTSAQQNPTHTYASTGTYDWTLTVTVNGKTCSKTGTVTVGEPCALTCSATAPTSGVAGVALAFQSSAEASHCAGSPAFAWTFGDGSTSTEQNPSHTYAAEGSYPWTLTVTADDRTCTQSGTVAVVPPCALACEAGAAPTSGVTPLAVAFTAAATATNCAGSPTFAWSFGDGSTSTEQNPAHTYAIAGTYSWTLTASVEGLTCTKTGTVTADEPCVLTCEGSATPAVGTAPLQVAFAATATAPHCAGTPTFAWTFGDGSTSTEQNPSHTYASAGTFPWALTVAVEGQTCTLTGSVTANPGLPGDGNNDGVVTIGEVQQAINMFLGTQPPGNGADCNGDGTVSIGEVQKVINAFLGLPSSC